MAVLDTLNVHLMKIVFIFWVRHIQKVEIGKQKCFLLFHHHLAYNNFGLGLQKMLHPGAKI